MVEVAKENALPGLPFAGVELGGTKCVCTLAYSPDHIIRQETVMTTIPDETLGAIEALLSEWSKDGIAALGINSFGPVDLRMESPRFGFITKTTKPSWSDTDIVRRLASAAGTTVAFDTDVNGAARAEMRWGPIPVPTRGFGHSELGHVRPVRLLGDDWPGACSFHGDCVEGLASGAALKARLQSRHVGDIPDDDPVWESVVSALAQLCHTLVYAACPERIAIGGGVMERQPHLLPRIQQALTESLAGYVELPRADYVVAPELGAQAGPMGSIALAMDAAAAR